ncbi:hypothetical protein PMG11_10308 [Penicillium brasilianum]|uniref:Major facilitator superfamily (MFS) profile domain-containing protein n=1 Tax=Penicillium brasilianum TaxID=104259 RepID=A0A0F7U299_PENBI|nr:hypothetical protein PMG11_10308 [Penicillium brasilianum]
MSGPGSDATGIMNERSSQNQASETTAHRQDEDESMVSAPSFRGQPFTLAIRLAHTWNATETWSARIMTQVSKTNRTPSTRERLWEPNDTPDGAADGTINGEPVHKERLVVVTFEGDCDHMDPHNWPVPRRLACTAVVSLTAATMLWATTIDAIVFTPETRKLYGTDNFAIETVPTALYLVGLGIGGLFIAPISEVVGRNPVFIPSLLLFILFEMGAGLARSPAQRMVTKGLAGFFGSAPLVCTAGSIVDLWSRIERVYIFPLYAILSFIGPLVGPVPGSFVAVAHAVSWRFVDWMTIILAGITLGLIALCMPETYSPILLHWKAKQLRRLTGDHRYRAPLEFKRVSFLRRLAHAIYRPFLLLAIEPIIMIFGVYLSAIFIILYTFIAGYMAIYEKVHKFTPTQTSLAFLGILVGVFLAALSVPLAMKLVRKDIRRGWSQGRDCSGPEISLYMSIFGAPAIPIALFWMGWMVRPSISVWFPIGSSVLLGYGVLCVFVSSYQYVAEAFGYHAASALAAVQMLRLVTSGVMVYVSEPMYRKLGIAWTLTLLGAIATVFLPVPYILYRWGPMVRRWSRHAQSEE